MSDAAPRGALTLLAYMLDEMRETKSLLPDRELSKITKRPWWRNIIFGVIGASLSKTEVAAGQSVQYLGENIDRARVHWREAIGHLQELRLGHSDNDLVVALLADLSTAGVDDVLPQLHHDAIPQSLTDTTAHLAGVITTIQDCNTLIVNARSRLMLQRMREDPVD